jgi:hypothetical protein
VESSNAHDVWPLGDRRFVRFSRNVAVVVRHSVRESSHEVVQDLSAVGDAGIAYVPFDLQHGCGVCPSQRA